MLKIFMPLAERFAGIIQCLDHLSVRFSTRLNKTKYNELSKDNIIYIFIDVELSQKRIKTFLIWSSDLLSYREYPCFTNIFFHTSAGQPY